MERAGARWWSAKVLVPAGAVVEGVSVGDAAGEALAEFLDSPDREGSGQDGGADQ